MPFFLILFLLFSTPVWSTEITILHFNDFHGHVSPNQTKTGTMGGLAKMAGLIKKIRAENKKSGRDTFVLFAGDVFTGTPISSLFQGAVDFESMNQLKLDAMCVGNHEFDYGLPRLTELRRKAEFPLVSANIINRATHQPEFGADVILSAADGTKIGVIGLTTPKTPLKTHPESVKGFSFTEPIGVTRQLARVLAKKTDVQIVLSHMEDSIENKLLANVPEIDLLIGGHDHHSPDVPHCVEVKKRLHCETPAYTNYLGRIDLKIEKKKLTILKTELIALDDRIQADPLVAKWIGPYAHAVEKRFSKVVAQAQTTIPQGREGESPLGNLITDALRAYTLSDVALINSGGIRGSLQAGPIRLGDIETILPFHNALQVVELRGKELEKIFQFSLQQKEGAFLQVSGLKIIGTEKNPKLYVNDQLIGPNDLFKVCSNSFLAEGGDGYALLKNRKVLKQYDQVLSDAVIDYFQRQKVLTPPTLGRIVFSK